MVTIVMNTKECDFAHEVLMPEAYRKGNDSGRSVAPGAALFPCLAEVGDKVVILRSTAFPQCP